MLQRAADFTYFDSVNVLERARYIAVRDPEVARTGHPDLAITLEDGEVDGEPMLFGELRLIPRQR